jgi:gluconate 2-dehydrogenase gamma chain
MTTPEPQARSFDRRAFLGGVVVGAGAGWLATLAACVHAERRARTTPTPLAPNARVLTVSEWSTLDAALDLLLPSGPGSPGARDCNGIGYLDAALADRDTDPYDVDLVRLGATWLNEDAVAAKATDFVGASPIAREVAMKTLGTRERGPDWLTLMLAFGLEAMLGDPIHGGNPGEIGWNWLNYTPGDPRPTQKTVEGPR